jgi:rhodanese-related sulfurtransferase
MRTIKSVVVIAAGMLAFAALSWAAPDFKTVNTAQLHDMVVDNAYEMEAGRIPKFTIVDARPRTEYDQVRIFGAISIPENDFEASLKKLPADKQAPLAVYGNSMESGESTRWAEKAASRGYANIRIYSDSLSAWRAKEYPVLPLGSIRK